MKSSYTEVEAVASAEAGATSAVTSDDESTGNARGNMKLSFFLNHNQVPIADLYMGERRLIATSHPATIVSAMFAMRRKRLEVVTPLGSAAATLRFLGPNQEGLPVPALKFLMSLRPEFFQFRHLAPDASYVPLLEGLDVFAGENWHEPNEVCDEYIRAAYHHLPPDVIMRPLLKPEPTGWKKTLKRRNRWIYYPYC